MILPMSTQSLTGGCHCGQLRYTVTGAPLNVMVCHCDSCKKVTGQPFFARAVFPASAVAFTALAFYGLAATPWHTASAALGLVTGLAGLALSGAPAMAEK